MTNRKINWVTATDALKEATVYAATMNAPCEGDVWDGVLDWFVRAFNVYSLWFPHHYLTDPRAWWPLVEEMGEITIERQRGGSWRIYWPSGTGMNNWQDADTPGEAVCIAFLRSKGVEVVT